MRLSKYILATTELLLVFPAVLFMTALFVRNLQPQQYEPAHTAQQIVLWYSGRPHIGLWVFLMAMPFAVLVAGAATLVHRWRREAGLRQAFRDALATCTAHLSTLLTAGATLAAGAILGIVALHVLTD